MLLYLLCLKTMSKYSLEIKIIEYVNFDIQGEI